MSSDRKGDWMVTFSGEKFHPLDPRPEEVHIIDIAHSLSMNNRYNGHTVRPYSVGLHSILCSLHAPKGFELEALLHDATEAYLADVVRPAKRGMPEYMAIEQALWENAISIKFGLPKTISEEVHLIDNIMLVTEADQLMGPNSPRWWEDAHWPDKIEGLVIPTLTWVEVKYLFLSRYNELTGNSVID